MPILTGVKLKWRSFSVVAIVGDKTTIPDNGGVSAGINMVENNIFRLESNSYPWDSGKE